MGSLWGQVTDCDRCDFHFSTHHTHEMEPALQPAMGRFFAVCIACAQEFALPTRGPWGPADGEFLQIRNVVRMPRSQRQIKHKVPLTLEYPSTGIEVLFSNSWREQRRIPGVACAACGAPESLAIDFASGEPCPRRKQGKLSCHQ